MKLHLHALFGTAPAPLAFYLKALGVFRLVAKQADTNARAFWKDDVFHLVTKLDADELEAFFLNSYAPTPLVSPWNGGSGFYPKDSKDGIDALAKTDAPRFAAYRRAIEAARFVVGARAERPEKEEKAELLQALRASLPEEPLDWLDAAVVLTGKDSAQYPALLGSGGNDGRLDFTNNQMQRIAELFDTATGKPLPGAGELLRASLFGAASSAQKKSAVGQFLPGGAGGANAAAGFSGPSLVNPWDFVLMLEGAVMFQVAAVRRLEGFGLPEAAAPFAVKTLSAGYASAATENARGEQWMPLWNGPATLSEVEALFHEGRLQSGTRAAETAVDAALAVGRLGTARGVTSFARFGYIERNGLSNFAVPLGRFAVSLSPHIELVDEIMPWVRALQHFEARAKNAPATLSRIVRRIQEAILSASRKDAPRSAFIDLLTAMATAEDVLVRRPKVAAESRLRPIPKLSRGWVDAAYDGSVEARLALAIASQRGPQPGFGSIREHCLPLTHEKGQIRFAVAQDALRKDAGVVWSGRDLIADLGQIALRRVVEASRAGLRLFPLEGRAFAGLDDIAAFLDGRVDDRRIASLARAFMAFGDDAWNAVPVPPTSGEAWVPHAIFRLAYLSRPLDDLQPRNDPAPLRLLLAGRLEDAADVALRGLLVRGVRPKIRHIVGHENLAKRLAAAISIPVCRRDAMRLSSIIAKPHDVDAGVKTSISR
ncbi:MAG: type I-U CRISPR-associated protein Csx17 [Polyangiaceae bacterium]|nr:type I-U CRISPR-associated protein Csx17 [Polyangiaceae bacterium]